MTRAKVEVRHNATASRFEATVEGNLSVTEYTLIDDVMRIHHTEVPPSLARRGIAGEMVKSAFAYAEANGLKVEPWCGYVRAYMKRHPETQHLLSADFPVLR